MIEILRNSNNERGTWRTRVHEYLANRVLGVMSKINYEFDGGDGCTTCGEYVTHDSKCDQFSTENIALA